MQLILGLDLAHINNIFYQISFKTSIEVVL